MSDIVTVFGERLRIYRKRTGLSQEKFAEKCDLNETYIGDIERGAKNPSLATLEKLSVGLQIPLSQLLDKIGTPFLEEDLVLPAELYAIMLELDTDKQKKLFQIVQAILDFSD